MSIHHIRTEIFGLTQRDFAEIAGTTQPTVFRWEKGELFPNAKHMAEIRRAARRRRLIWDDRWFFETPGAGRNGRAA